MKIEGWIYVNPDSTDPRVQFLSNKILQLAVQTQQLRTLNKRLSDELIDERDRHDKLQDFEVAESKELADLRKKLDQTLVQNHCNQTLIKDLAAKAEERKLSFNVAMWFLEQAGVDTERFIDAVALKVSHIQADDQR